MQRSRGESVRAIKYRENAHLRGCGGSRIDKIRHLPDRRSPAVPSRAPFPRHGRVYARPACTIASASTGEKANNVGRRANWIDWAKTCARYTVRKSSYVSPYNEPPAMNARLARKRSLLLTRRAATRPIRYESSVRLSASRVRRNTAQRPV